MDSSKPNCSKTDFLTFLKTEKIETESVMMALKQAEFTHRYRTRDDGKSYLTQHIYPLTVDVYKYFKGKKDVQTAVVVALLHDVPEDDPNVNEKRLITEYGSEVSSLVMYLQKPKKNKQIRYQQDKHEEHIEFAARVKKAPFLCQVIKLLDRINNLKCTEGAINPEKYERFLSDTTECYLPLAELVDQEIVKQMKEEIIRISQELHR